MILNRRAFLTFLAGLPFISWFSNSACKSANAELPLTPSCGDHPTPAQTEGPYFTPDSPERSNLREAGMQGTLMVVAGRVLDTNCRPVANALLDWWHANDQGEYDNAGYRLRGHQYTDKQGNFRVETIRPGLYPGRTRHFHVKVQAPGKSILTTQLYFPDEPGNARDRIFNSALLLKLTSVNDVLNGAFDFVVHT